MSGNRSAVRITEDAGLYYLEPPLCHCGRVCCRHHADD